MLNYTKWLIIIIFLIITSATVFTLIYYNAEGYTNNFDDALYLAIQVQTSIGVDVTGIENRTPVKNWITVQSIIAYTLNIFIVIFISVAIGQNIAQASSGIIVK